MVELPRREGRPIERGFLELAYHQALVGAEERIRRLIHERPFLRDEVLDRVIVEARVVQLAVEIALPSELVRVRDVARRDAHRHPAHEPADARQVPFRKGGDVLAGRNRHIHRRGRWHWFGLARPRARLGTRRSRKQRRRGERAKEHERPSRTTIDRRFVSARPVGGGLEIEALVGSDRSGRGSRRTHSQIPQRQRAGHRTPTAGPTPSATHLGATTSCAVRPEQLWPYHD